MDLFDMSLDSLEELAERRAVRDSGAVAADALCAIPPSKADLAKTATAAAAKKTVFITSLPSSHAYIPSLRAGLAGHRHPTLVMGVQSDTLFPVEQQRELAECLKANGNEGVVYYELSQPWGHDTFLLDVNNIGSAVKGFLESSSNE